MKPAHYLMLAVFLGAFVFGWERAKTEKREDRARAIFHLVLQNKDQLLSDEARANLRSAEAEFGKPAEVRVLSSEAAIGSVHAVVRGRSRRGGREMGETMLVDCDARQVVEYECRPATEVR